MKFKVKSFLIKIIGGANIATILIALILGYSDRFDAAAHALLSASGMVFPVFALLNAAERPFLVFGQGVLLGHAEKELEAFLRKAADAPQPNVLALNDLAEVLRRTKNYGDAERYARLAVEKAPEFYIVWETLGTVRMAAGKDAAEAEECVAKAIELQKKSGAKTEDVRIYSSLARAQLLRGDKKAARQSIRKVRPRISELNEYERREFEEIEKRVK